MSRRGAKEGAVSVYDNAAPLDSLDLARRGSRRRGACRGGGRMSRGKQRRGRFLYTRTPLFLTLRDPARGSRRRGAVSRWGPHVEREAKEGAVSVYENAAPLDSLDLARRGRGAAVPCRGAGPHVEREAKEGGRFLYTRTPLLLTLEGSRSRVEAPVVPGLGDHVKRRLRRLEKRSTDGGKRCRCVRRKGPFAVHLPRANRFAELTPPPARSSFRRTLVPGERGGFCVRKRRHL